MMMFVLFLRSAWKHLKRKNAKIAAWQFLGAFKSIGYMFKEAGEWMV